MSLSPLMQQQISCLLVIAWVAVGAVLIFRANRLGKAYLRRLPLYEGVPLDIYIHVGKGWKKGGGPVQQAFREQQADSELELLRQVVRQRSRYALVWMFGFPALVIGIAALLIATGIVRPQ